MRNKYLLCIAALMLTGCAGETTVSYVDDTKSETATEASQSTEATTEAESTGWDDSNLDGAEWKEDIDVVNDKGEECTFSIKSKVTIVEEDKNTYDYEIIRKLSPEQKKTLAEAIFDDGKVYLYEEENTPKQVWEQGLDFWRELMDASTNNADKDYYQEMIDDLEEKLEKAPLDLIPATDYTGRYYLGYIEGLPYSLELTFENEITATLDKDISEHDPNGTENYRVWGMYLGLYSENNIDADKWALIDKVNPDDINKTLDKIATSLGSDGQLKLSENADSDNTFEIAHNVGTFFSGATYTIPYKLSDDDGNERVCDIYIGGEKGNVGYIDKTAYIWLQNPYKSLDVRKDGELLPFEQIIQAIKNELNENPDYYMGIQPNPNNKVYTYDSLERGYVAIADEQGEKVSKIPCWRLQDRREINASIFVNALDGTIIRMPRKVTGTTITMDNGVMYTF